MIPILVDTDGGIDDAIALALAIRLETLSLVAVTTVAGNVDVFHATGNARRVLDYVGARAVPVARGAARPLLRPHRDARHVHGTDGLGGAELTSGRPGPIIDTTAPEVIVRTARRYAGTLRLVCLGPLTNLALALRLEPRLPELVERLVIMGGAFWTSGNVTPFAEFNVWSDPEAARIVAEEPFRALWVGLDVTNRALLKRKDREVLTHGMSPEAELLVKVTHKHFARGQEGLPLHDPLALAVASAPDLVQAIPAVVKVDTSAGETAGQTVCTADVDASSLVAQEVDIERFFALFRSVFSPSAR